MITVDPLDTPVHLMHQYLLGAVAPRPIAFASTVDASGRHNLAPFSFFNVFSVKPPVVIFSPARRGRDNTTKHTYENVKQVKECVINIVNFDIVQQMSVASGEYADGVDEFVKSGLTPLASEKVRPLRVKESPVHLECIVREVIELGDQGGAGNLILCEVVLVHVDEKILDHEGRIDPHLIDQVARLGGNWYTRTRSGLFELPQPNTHLGIGFDNLPAEIRHSSVLTGNQLGQLASIHHLPDETAVNEYKLTELSDIFLTVENALEREHELHRRAATLLDEHKILDAWLTLLAYNA